MNEPRGLAPETHNSEQDDEPGQAQTVAEQAKQPKHTGEDKQTVKSGGAPIDGGSAQDLVDHMKAMDTSGRIDMSAYRGEPNHDDDAGKYGKGHDAEFEDDDS